jgi:hypothetical protein
VNQIIYLLERKTGLPLPKITMINLALNDFVGHSTGPHSDLIRSSSLADTDFRTGRILDAYRKAGIFEKTIFVITGDHGQEMQDRNRSLPYRVEGEKFILPLFEDAGIKYIGAPPFVYFRTIGLSVDPGVLPQAGPVSLSVTAFDYDTRKALASTAIEAFTGGKAAGSCTTGEGGACSIDIADAAGGVKIVAERADYNKAEWP